MQAVGFLSRQQRAFNVDLQIFCKVFIIGNGVVSCGITSWCPLIPLKLQGIWPLRSMR